ncbi:MAG: beta-carotene hydroxylase, partial [Spirochaetes bacterium]|nr:beta-carotene hydroxylase [Spirochaetota bacterium]
LFALPSFLCIFLGLLYKVWFLPPIGFGMALYGIAYTLFHDVMFHRRVRWLRLKPRGRYFDGIMTAHRLHHRVNTRYGSRSYGFLYAPRAYRNEASWP